MMHKDLFVIVIVIAIVIVVVISFASLFMVR